MKKEFYGYYEPTKEELDAAWTSGIIVLDTNTLLNLYRYTEGTRKDVFLALNALLERLHMPYQVGQEFHTNRRFVIEGLKASYRQLGKLFEERMNADFIGQVKGYNRHPVIDISKLEPLVADFIKKVKDEINQQQKTHPDFLTNDDVRDELNKLFENKVGKKLSDEALEKLYKTGDERYAKKIPPGYKDKNKQKQKGNENDLEEQTSKIDANIYGDLIIWFALIELSKETKRPIIFVTDDRKQDWWEIAGGKNIGPRQELTKEFYDETGRRILIYTPGTFLRLVKERKIIDSINDASIAEIIEVRKADVKTEKYLEASNEISAERSKSLINPGEDWSSKIFKRLNLKSTLKGLSPSLVKAILAEHGLFPIQPELFDWNELASNSFLNYTKSAFGPTSSLESQYGYHTNELDSTESDSIPENELPPKKDSGGTTPPTVEKPNEDIPPGE